MIRALVTGSLYGPPQARTSQAGKQYVTAKVRADGKDGAVVWCSVIAFGEQADRLMTLGDVKDWKADLLPHFAGVANSVANLTVREIEAAADRAIALEVLATVKNPPVVFAKQANIAQQQQVNNGPAVPAVTRARNSKAARLRFAASLRAVRIWVDLRLPESLKI